MRNSTILHQLFFVGSLFSVVSAVAQDKGYDKKTIEQQAKISEDSSKLVKFNGMVPQFEQDKKRTADQAQQSADDNKTAATRLSNDPQDKKLAKKADRTARDARSDAKRARVAAVKLDDLNKDIEKLTKQLNKERDKLGKYQQDALAASAAKAATDGAAKADSTNH
jgi:outer membrane murein-binding lipoprotein Lpp